MNKLIVAGIVFFAATVAVDVVAATDAKRQAALTGIDEEQRKNDAEEYRYTGGYVKRPNTQKGRVVYVNCQKRVSDHVLKANAALMERELNFSIEVENGSFDLKAPKVIGEASLFVIDDPTLPTLLSAPEDKWAVVNVARLVGEGENADLELRAGKELSRGFALLGGAFQSQFERTLTGCITDPKQLDKFPDVRLPFDSLRHIEKYLPGYGLAPYERVAYCDAVAEGWAPAPKDDVQRRVKADTEAELAKQKKSQK